MNILCPRAGGNPVQKQFMLLNDFLLYPSRAGSLRRLRSRAGPRARGGLAKLRFASVGTTPIIHCPRAGGNSVQKQFMLLNDFLLPAVARGCHSVHEWSKITYPKEETALVPGGLRVPPPGLRCYASPESELSKTISARRENHSVSTHIEPVDFPLSVWRAVPLGTQPKRNYPKRSAGSKITYSKGGNYPRASQTELNKSFQIPTKAPTGPPAGQAILRIAWAGTTPLQKPCTGEIDTRSGPQPIPTPQAAPEF